MAAANIGWTRILYEEIFLQNWSDHETYMESHFENRPRPATTQNTIEKSNQGNYIKSTFFLNEFKMLLKTNYDNDFSM